MRQNEVDKGRVSDGGHGIGTVTEQMVEKRAAEIAVINGRSKHNVLTSDLDQARRELQGEERLMPTPSKAELIPEEDRWAPEGGSTGQQAPTVAAPDEQGATAKLVEEGIAEAEHDQELQATRESLRREKRS